MNNLSVKSNVTININFREWMNELSEQIERVTKLFPHTSTTNEPQDYQPDIDYCTHDSYFCRFPKCRLGFQCKEAKLIHEITAHDIPDTLKRDSLEAIKAKIKDSSGRSRMEEHSCCDKPKKPCRVECDYCPVASSGSDSHRRGNKL